jgi:signal peptide peptidase SppA
MSKFDEFRAALRGMDGACAFESPTLLSIIAELRRGDVTDQRLRALQRPSRTAIGSLSARPTMTPTGKGGKYTAIVSAHGVALYNFEAQPYAFSTLTLARVINQLSNDPTIENVVIDFNTPGGMVTGTQEASDAVFAAAKKKRVIGLINPLCASAGYWIASQCSSIVTIPTGDVGSIGVFVLHVDQSKMLEDIGLKATFVFAGEHKVEGNSLQPLSAAAKQFWQSQVDQTYADFLKAVARGRNTTVSNVRTSFGGGRCYSAKDALRVGMIDHIQAPDAAIQEIVAGSLPSRSAVGAGSHHRALLAGLAADHRSPEQKRAAELARHRLAILGE